MSGQEGKLHLSLELKNGKNWWRSWRREIEKETDALERKSSVGENEKEVGWW